MYGRIECVDIQEPMRKIGVGLDAVFDDSSCSQLTELRRA